MEKKLIPVPGSLTGLLEEHTVPRRSIVSRRPLALRCRRTAAAQRRLHPQLVSAWPTDSRRLTSTADYQAKCTIKAQENRTGAAECAAPNAGTARRGAPEAAWPPISVEMDGKRVPVAPKIGQFEMISLELLLKKYFKISSINSDNDNGGTTNNYHLPEQRTDFMVLGGCD